MGMLIGSKGQGVRVLLYHWLEETNVFQASETLPFTRCLVETALASNAPTPLKTQVRIYFSLKRCLI